MILMSAKQHQKKGLNFFLFHITPNLGSVLRISFLQNWDEAGDVGGGGGDGGGRHGGGEDEGGRGRSNQLEASLAHCAGH